MAKKERAPKRAGAAKPKKLHKKLRKAEANLATAKGKRDRAQARVEALSIIADEIRAQLAETEKAKSAAEAAAKPATASAAKPGARPKSTPARKPAAAKKSAPAKRPATPGSPAPAKAKPASSTKASPARNSAAAKLTTAPVKR